MTTLCLCMIIRNEAPVIRRCLASVRPIVDSWLIVDTGSSDGSQAIVREAMVDLPGELVERPWVDFAFNRSEALELARPYAKYCLVIDADDELILPPGFTLPTLEADGYAIDIADGGVAYRRTQVFASAKPWLAIDVDNFVVPSTLRELVALDLPIVAPLVREALAGARYANYHAKVDAAGYLLETPRYDEILHRRITGIIELPVVHCTYLVRADVIPRLTYEDGSERFDYVIFSDSARRAGIPQYIDNRQVYGYLTLNDDDPAIVAGQLQTLARWFREDGSRDGNSDALPF